MASLTGGHIIAQAMANEGCKALFTLCGGHIQDIYDGCLDRDIRVVDFRHEQSAAHAADGWARITGEPGVAAVTAGPGVTDAATAVASAQRAQVPMILIGGQGPVGFQEKGSLQEMNHVEFMRPITKWSTSIHETRRLGEFVAQAFRVATTWPYGPVFLEVPLDILVSSADEKRIVFPQKYRTRALPAGEPDYIRKAADLLKNAKNPVVLLSSQVYWSRHRDTVKTFVDWLKAPVFVNGQGRGMLGPNHPYQFTTCRKKALAACDVLLNFGTPLDFRIGYGDPPTIPANVQMITVDMDGAMIGKGRGVEVGLIGDSGLVMAQLMEAMGTPGDYSDSVEAMRQHEEKGRSQLRLEDGGSPVHPHRFAHELNKLCGPKTIFVGDGGDIVASAAKVLTIHGPGQWMDPGPLGTLGVGTGYAMAAKLAKPDHEVIVVYGDGSFGLNGMDFEAAARQGINIKGVIGNDASWNQIRRGQLQIYGDKRCPATKLSYVEYDKVVKALGGDGENITRPEDLKAAYERMLKSDVPYVVNVHVGADELRAASLSV